MSDNSAERTAPSGGAARERRPAELDVLADVPVGPDDLGNVVIHGLGLLNRGWRWLARKVARRA